MKIYLALYAIAAAITLFAYLATKVIKGKYLQQFRSQLLPGQIVLVEYNGSLELAEIQNLHNDLVFVWLPDYGFFNYVEPSKIFPDDYK